MVKNVSIAMKKGSKEDSKPYMVLSFDFGYRSESIYVDDTIKGMLYELTGVDPEKIYTMNVGDSFPILFKKETK